MNATDEVTPRLRTVQIIALALVTGVVVFLAIALYVVGVQNGGRGLAPPDGPPVLTLVALVFMGVNAVLSFVVPASVTRSNLRRMAAGTWSPAGDAPPSAAGPGPLQDGPRPPLGLAARLQPPATEPGRLMQVRQTADLVGLALVEGACFLAIIAYLLEGQPWALALAGVGVCLMVARFPTGGRVRGWLDKQHDLLARMRQEGDGA
jgi:hypothetical protein